ncbi:hypothetical protein GC105_15825 [Alkalibaculum sp. M08DMB]|uniref:Collagen-like protein n=1 Tax=Alkalibaculum sporogenes TaxID=2655001 RepID=A0A6A7KDK5_9FIRM|nr:hypothetical protein [Alkalibaculum sporogenes]MPW27237.1 hypothetical protein [Alkalibaculum sporogenes]
MNRYSYSDSTNCYDNSKKCYDNSKDCYDNRNKFNSKCHSCPKYIPVPIPGPAGPPGAAGPVGPVGPAGPPGPALALSGIQTQLTGAPATIIADGANVIFDTTINNPSPNIVYDNATGNFTINEPGNYLINWWIAVDGAGASIEVIFTVEVAGGPSISAASVPPNTSLQLSGDALISITTVPSTLSLVNNTGEDVFLANNIVQANMTII